MIIGIHGKTRCGKDLAGKIVNYIACQKKFPKFNELDKYINADKSSFPVKVFKTVKFADKLKDIVCLLIGCTRAELEDDDFKDRELGEEWWYYKTEKSLLPYNEYDSRIFDGSVHPPLIKLTPRKLLQLIGTECGRKIIHPNIWVNATMAGYRSGTVRTNFATDENGNLIAIPSHNVSDNWVITDVRFPNEVQAIKDRGGIVISINRDMKYRYPKEWAEYVEALSAINSVSDNSADDPTEDDFMNYLSKFNTKLHAKLTHESETSLDAFIGFDWEVEATEGYEVLYEGIKEAIVELGVTW